jgi:aminopeptidase N
MILEDRNDIIRDSRVLQRPVVDFSVKDYMQLLNTNSYQKGGWVLHMLRNMMGDEAFWKGIRLYYAKYSGKNATTDNLREALEEVSGQDLKAFFKQWLFTAGHPQLDIAWKYEEGKKEVTITVTQRQNQVFQFPLEIRLTGKDDQPILTKTISVTGKQTTAVFPAGIPVEKLIADPSLKLLFEGRIIRE